MYFQLTSFLSCSLVEDHWIFLDCRGDRYFAVPAERMPSGIPDLGHPAIRSRAASDLRKDALEPVTVHPPKAKLDTGEGQRDLKVRLIAFCFLLRAFARRSGHFTKLEAVSAKGKLRAHDSRPKKSLELCVRSFEKVMRWFPVESQCLPQALALQEFLVSAGHDVTVVVGVSTNPFKAHCWVQKGDRVLLQAPEFVRGYSPVRMFQ
ncbi:lasso peptide biosynthesis B2 protein [Sphingobium yanoikuyae]|uniref:Lasso peptide biosynthesis B2 protein n=1 Tax=Sphingobium yanoikuyae TaxID=13690 RepID=A0AA43BEP5_SPHYA|nr:lasso peptide biosynthesis B2 protein [Sphingobium yanoikuyae]MDH2134804.1 lasso peptide biosynthesis B2 protein [Sphingobium yanoikuyae]MDH2153614.1 lasso peptide biosynthesis B2 protein [Sphingobium yanoikuyae]MDH2170700.1 lasso peptide biosynthesis B2 protein [Sphingobium yanoikuyae]